MKLHKEGRNILFGFGFLFVIINFLIVSYIPSPWSIILIALVWIFYGFIVWFFRNPDRIGNFGPKDIVAPVDGKVVVLEEVEETEFLNTRCIQLSIFMSPLNVHVNRYPVSGKVVYTKYHPGKYLVAFHPKSSVLNERTTVVVEAENGNHILFRQIAGAVARRIVLYSKEGDTANAGNEYGFIKFGSRLDVFLPLGTKFLVKIGDKTLGGVQKIAELN
ncbi:MAG: phosphatidylserine decarboxylase family protein [Moheibacter sp.]